MALVEQAGAGLGRTDRDGEVVLCIPAGKVVVYNSKPVCLQLDWQVYAVWVYRPHAAGRLQDLGCGFEQVAVYITVSDMCDIPLCVVGCVLGKVWVCASVSWVKQHGAEQGLGTERR